jgi:hypothetical protein
MCLTGVTEVIVQVCKLIAKTGRALMKGGRALPGLCGGVSGSLRFARRVPGSGLGFVAELLEKPDAFDQLLACCRIHDFASAGAPAVARPIGPPV